MAKRGKSNRVTPPEQILTGYFYYNGKSLSFNVHRNKPNNYYKNSKYHISINEKKAIEIVYIECLKYYNEIIADYETIKENFIKRNKPKSILASLKKEQQILEKEQEDLVERLLSGKIDQITYTFQKDMLKEKILYNEELQYKQKELEINYKNDLNNFIEFLDKIKDVNANK